MKLEIDLSDHIWERLQSSAAAAGESEEDHATRLLQRALIAPPPGRRASARIRITTPIVGLVEGLLFGDTTLGEALQSGNFGLGTVNGLDGEVVILNGQAYRQLADGSSVAVPPSALTPFLCTTTFDKAQAKRLELAHPLDWAGLQMALQEEFSSANVFYAILVEGSFSHIKARAVRKQTEARPLAAVAREQALFELEDQTGCLVGFWSPAFMGHALTVPGFHLHFLSSDHQRGGHILDLKMERGTAYIQAVYHADTDLPQSLDFLKANLSDREEEQKAELAAAEK